MPDPNRPYSKPGPAPAWTDRDAGRIVAPMSFLLFMQRWLSFGAAARPPATEEFQSVILTHLSMQGATVLAEIGRQTFPQLDEEMRRYALAEAAQILVNRGEVGASRNGFPVNPVACDWAEVVLAPKAGGLYASAGRGHPGRE